ncbi:hypothetical protein [Methylibium sp.]|uniref:hypothetical protein n=1 Tax=Methylibium sp. TaxID=2067992 RepID=UPI00286C0E67|nr:hypothetical protein [Methylibium sp.]
MKLTLESLIYAGVLALGAAIAPAQAANPCLAGVAVTDCAGFYGGNLISGNADDILFVNNKVVRVAEVNADDGVIRQRGGEVDDAARQAVDLFGPQAHVGDAELRRHALVLAGLGLVVFMARRRKT